MDDQHSNDTASPASGGGFFAGTKGWIAGLTGVITALTGLVVACDKFAGPDTPGDKPPVAAMAAKPSRAQLYIGQQDDGTSVSIKRTDDGWDVTDKTGTYSYEELVSSDDGRILAKSNQSYLRWPIKGGMAEEGAESEDSNTKSWTDYADVTPAQPTKP